MAPHDRLTSKFRPFVLLAALALAGCAGQGSFRRGQNASDLGDYDRAVIELSRAAALEPKNVEFRSALQRSREKASTMHSDRGRAYMGAARYADAAAEFSMATAIFPGNTHARDQLERAQKLLDEQRKHGPQSGSDLEDAKRRAAGEIGVPKLKPRNTDPISIDMEDKPQRQALDAIARATGINFIYDERLEQDLDRKRVSLHLRNVSFDEAMEIILAKTATMYKIYNETTLLLAPDNPESGRKYEDLVMRTFYLSNAQAKDVFQQVRSLIDVKKLSQNEQLNSITIRGTPDQVAMAQKVIDLNDKSKGEVVIDVEIIEVSHTVTESLGIALGPTAVSVAGGGATTLLNWRSIAASKGAYTVTGLPSATVNFLRTDSQSKTLANPSVRVTEGEKADLHIGDRFPIFNCTTNIGTGTGGFQTCTPTYTDIGIQIKLEPRVHHNHEVSIKLDLKVNTLGAPVSSGGANPQTANAIGERSINTIIRMADGESEMLAGMLRDDNNNGVSGYPGLTQLPLLKALFGKHDKTHNQTDVILLLTPHIIRFPNITDKDLDPVWVGTEDKPKLVRPGAALSLTSGAGSASGGNGDEAGDAQEPGRPAPEGGKAPPAGGALPVIPDGKPGEPPAPPKESPADAPPGVVHVTLSPPTLHFKSGTTGQLHVLAAGVGSLSRVAFTLNRAQLPLQCATVEAGEVFTAGGGQPVVQFTTQPDGDCRVTITRGGGSGAVSAGELAALGLASPVRGSDILKLVAIEAVDGKGAAVPIVATSAQVIVE